MTSEEKYKYWEMLSDYDIETAAVLVKEKRWLYVSFLCEQSIERILKGMYVFYCGKEAPKSHNVNYLLTKISHNPLFLSKVDMEAFDEKLKTYENFFYDLVFYYISDYPFSYQKIMDRFIDEATAIEIYNKTLEVRCWLQDLQKPKARAVR